ncbi:DUF3558 domain-containing protein [Nocardiopsis alba]|uniref:DUF3558 domain-containing protein n=1 Tax=Nocardiopsis alba TaxID=53437 RepID=UPI0033EDF53D
MSENGPYNQPPQNPYGGGDGTGGQPPYGPGTGGQPGYGQAPYPGGPGQDPGMYAGAPGQDQGMYAGGQPPYGGPGGPMGPGAPGAYPPPPQPPKSGGKAGLWVVIGGGVIIVVLVIAVIIMLVARGGGDDQVVTPDPTTEAPVETDEPAEEPVAGGEGPSGEPPYALPQEPCEAYTDQVMSDFLLSSDPGKSVSDNSATCSTIGDSPEGNPDDAYGSLNLSYSVPYSGSDSIEAATSEFQSSVDYYTGGNDDYYPADSITEDKALDGLGDEAHLVITEYDYLGDLIPVAVLMVRTANVNIELTYQINGLSVDPEDLSMPDNAEDIMTSAAAEALAIVGS